MLPFFPSALHATDALSAYELGGFPKYKIPGLETAFMDVDDHEKPIPQHFFITSPNMTTIPDITKDTAVVRVRKDGRFATADFTLFPQWYAVGTYYLPYVRKKPQDDDPYASIWYNVTHKDFVRETGSSIGGMGRLSESLASLWTKLRRDLMAKIKIEVASGKHSTQELKELLFCERGMQFASITLVCAPQTYEAILLTATSFQRYFLETLACYEYLTHWKDLPANPNDEPRAVAHVIGTLTVEVEVAVELYDKGVPVWLVRRPPDFPLSTTIVNLVYPTIEPMEFEFLHGSVALWSGPAGAFRNRVCQSLRMSNIQLGHSAYHAPAGPYLPVNNQSSYFAVTVVDQTHFSSLTDVVLNEVTLPGAQVTSSVLPEPMDTAPIQTAQSNSSSSSMLRVASTGSLSSSRSPSNEPRLPTPPIASSSGSRASSRAFPSQRSNSVASLSAAPAPTLQISKEKFGRPKGPLAPTPNRVWMVALESVVADRNRVCDHPNKTLFRGYALPDPHLFLTSGRSALYTICWLTIKPLWLNMATNRVGADGNCSPYPEPQDWRAFLTDLCGKMGLEVASSSGSQPHQNTSEAKETKESRHGREKRRRIKDDANRVDKFKLDTSLYTSLSDVFWRGRLLLTKDALRNNQITVRTSVAKEIIWELFNQNFALELLALDRVIFPRDNMTDEEGMERDAKVSACFPDGILVGMNYPIVDQGLGALRWRDRIEYVEAFRMLLSTWRGPMLSEDVALRLGGLPLVEATATEQHVEALEMVAYAFYCQTFFDHFGRAPCVPCRLPQD